MNLPQKENRLNIFYCYARKDQSFRDQLEQHLSNLKRSYHLETWFDRQIQPGDIWEIAIDTHLKMADLILLLISPDFMASNYCYNREMQHALEMHMRGTATVIPILLRWVHWKNAPFSHLQMLPSNAQPITSWSDHDAAFYDIVVGIENIILAHLTAQKKEGNNLFKQETVDPAAHTTTTIDVRGTWQEITSKSTHTWTLTQSGTSLKGTGTHKNLYYTNKVSLTGTTNGYIIDMKARILENNCSISYQLLLDKKQMSMSGEWISSCNGDKGKIELHRM